MAGSANVVAELVGGIMNPAAQGRLQHALGSSGLGASTNPLAGLLQNLQGQGGAASTQRNTGAGGLAGLARQLFGGISSSPGAAGGAGALTGMLFGGTKGAMRGGALAVLGSLAVSALSQSGRAQPPSSPDELPGALRAAKVDPEDDPELSARADLLLEAMVLAAKADGRLDDQELQHIQGRMAEDGLDQAELQQLARLAHGGADFEGLIARIHDPQTAAEVYAASAMAIRIDTEAEWHHLAALAERTGLDAETVAELHRMLGLS